MKNRVKQFRLKKNISQVKLATAANVTRQTISLIEKGEYNPSLQLCLQICYALGKTLDEIFWNDDQQGAKQNEKNYR